MKTLIPLLSLLMLAAAPLVAQDNYIKNHGFEEEDSGRPGQATEWFAFTQSGSLGASAVSTEAAAEGTKSYKLTSEGTGNAEFVGLSQGVRVSAGQKVKFSCYVRNVDLQDPAYGQLGLEWHDAANQEISRDLGEGINAQNTSTSEWTRFELVGTAPDGAEGVAAVLTLHAKGTESASLLVDKMSLIIEP